MSEKTPTEVAEIFSAEKPELKKNKLVGAITGEVGVRLMEVLLLLKRCEQGLHKYIVAAR